MSDPELRQLRKACAEAAKQARISRRDAEHWERQRSHLAGLVTLAEWDQLPEGAIFDVFEASEQGPVVFSPGDFT